MVRAGYVWVAIIHRTLTWTTHKHWISYVCADYRIFIVRTDVNACDCTRACTDTGRESALKVDSGKKNPCRTWESNQCQRRTGPMLWPTELHPIPSGHSYSFDFFFFFFNEKNDDIEILTLILQRRRDEIEIVLTRSDALSAVVDWVWVVLRQPFRPHCYSGKRWGT